MKVGARQYSLWTIAITLVLIFALVPVLWLLSISLKPPSEITDGRVIPSPPPPPPRSESPAKRPILAFPLAIAMSPPISTVGPLFDMWRALGIYDTYIGLIIPYLTFSLPLAVYVLVAFFREIP